MIKRIVADTGSIVSMLKNNEDHHDWAFSSFETLPKPFLTCEPVITEACFLMHPSHNGERDVLLMIENGIVEIDFSTSDEIEALISLMRKYDDVPMSLADACLVRMSEIYAESAILTLDTDFLIYRKHRNRSIPLIMPDGI